MRHFIYIKYDSEPKNLSLDFASEFQPPSFA